MRVRVLAVAAAAALAVVGCGGSKGEPVNGNVVIGGKAYNPETDGPLTVRLGGTGDKGYVGQVKDDGTFQVKYTDGVGGVPPGKYRVSITKYPTKAEMEKLKGPPTPLNKNLSEEWDVVAGKTFTLDMSKVK